MIGIVHNILNQLVTQNNNNKVIQYLSCVLI